MIFWIWSFDSIWPEFQWESWFFSLDSAEAQKTSRGNFLMTWTCATDFLSGSFCWAHLDVSSIKEQAATPRRARSLLGRLWNAQQDAAGITSIVPVSVQKQESSQCFQLGHEMAPPYLAPASQKQAAHTVSIDNKHLLLHKSNDCWFDSTPVCKQHFPLNG